MQLDPKSLELSMGMSHDFEQAVFFIIKLRHGMRLGMKLFD